MSIWKLVIIDWLSNVSTPISLKTNNKTPTYFIEHPHICVFSNGSKRIYIQLYIKTLCFRVLGFSNILKKMNERITNS